MRLLAASASESRAVAVIAVSAATIAAPFGGLGAAVVAAAGVFGIVAITRAISATDERTTWLKVGLAAHGLHVLIAVGMFAALTHLRGSATVFDDDVSYDRVARAIAALIHGEGDGVSTSDLYLVSPWPVVMGLLYAVFGPSLLAA